MISSTPCCIIPKRQEHHDQYYCQKQQQQQLLQLNHQRNNRRKSSVSVSSLSLFCYYFNCFILLSVIIIKPMVVYGFPSWLKCDVDIIDKEEIIMNYYVIHPEFYSNTDVMHELVQIEIQPYINNIEVLPTTKYEKPTLITSSSDSSSSYYTYEYPAGDIISTYNIRLYIPQPSDHSSIKFAMDIQYAIDIINIEYDDHNNNEDNATKYIEPSIIVCNGQRIYIQNSQDNYATIQINSSNTKSIRRWQHHR